MSRARNVRRLRNTGILIVGLVLIFFFYQNTKNLIGGPTISITSPKDNEVIETSLITITGTVKNAASITLNGHQIFVDESGHFSEKLLLPLGYSILRVEALDREKDMGSKEVHVWRKN
jgi:hypothetical protein